MPWGETIVHIAIDDVHLTDCNGEEISSSISHAPISPEALDRSVTELVRESGPIPDFAEGYADWEMEGGTSFNTSSTTVEKVVTLLENAWRYGTERPDQ